MKTTPPTSTAPGSVRAEHHERIPIDPTWKPDWSRAKRRLRGWWRGEDLAVSVTAPLDVPRLSLPLPPQPVDARDKWVGRPGRVRRETHRLSRTYLGGECVPVSHTMCIGAGDLAAMLGCGWRFSDPTVWFEPCISDPDHHPPLTLDRGSEAFQTLTQLLRDDIQQAAGRYLTGIPDLVENFDILAALRDPQTLLLDIYDRPGWIEQKIDEINGAFFEAFDHFYELARDDEGGCVFTAFGLWGPGKTAKVQCDACSMFGPDQFKQFVVPALTEQCDWLDYSMYHLDGEECWPNLDLLLAIESLDAIEWTPKLAYANEGGGHPKWYDLYRRIKAAGKSVQAICVKPDEVIPLLDAVGPEGMYIQCHAAREMEAEALLKSVQPYYQASDATP